MHKAPHGTVTACLTKKRYEKVNAFSTGTCLRESNQQDVKVGCKIVASSKNERMVGRSLMGFTCLLLLLILRSEIAEKTRKMTYNGHNDIWPLF